MQNHDIVSNLKVNIMAKEAGLSVREMEILLMLRFSGSMVTPTVNRMLGINRSDMNKRVGPKLEELGWLTHAVSVHRQRDCIPTKRWYLAPGKQEELERLGELAYEKLNTAMTSSYPKDLDWVEEQDSQETNDHV